METSTTRFWQRGILFLLVWLACGLSNAFAAELGQINGTNKQAWSETSGWLNFKPTNGGVTVHAQYLSGYAWAANVGWVKLGADGGGPYANTTATNWGVNRNANGTLEGYAWSENAGWINFEHSQGQVSIDPATGDFSGYAWSANLGYIHFANVAPAYKVQSSPVVVSNPGAPAVPSDDANGAYQVSWTASSTNGVSYVLQESTNSGFNPVLRTFSTSSTSVSITGQSTNKTYYYRIKAIKASFTDSAWRAAGNGCLVKFTAGIPASIKVPTRDADGKCTVSWGASATSGVTYVLQEATNNSFSAGLRTAYTGTGRSAGITRRASGKTYYYRVKATKTGYTNSTPRAGANGCLVKLTVGIPASITVPVLDPDGKYQVKWGKSATAGVRYVLQEATNYTFTKGLRTLPSTTRLYVNITRPIGKTYYYRVKAIRAGYTDSVWRNNSSGNAVPGRAVVAAPTALRYTSIISHGYTVNWKASALAGVTYILEEARNSGFTVGLRTIDVKTAKFCKITRRTKGVTYYYRVRAIKAGFRDSTWLKGSRKAT